MKHLTALLSLYLISALALAEPDKLVHTIRFSDYETGSEEDWLVGEGFRFEMAAKRRNVVDLKITDNGLLIEMKRRAFGIMIK